MSATSPASHPDQNRTVSEKLQPPVASRGLDYGTPGAGHARLNFATSPEHLSEAVTRMARATAGDYG
ncbi:MAG TPA: hypothetical protein VHZ27_09585 [Solirubrobacteraceae bacterium]|nr:hypothetical protein [Solirubrobacteraceae bacterium]